MATYAIVKNGAVINTILWDGNPESWQPDQGTEAVVLPDGSVAGIGWSWTGSEFVPPPARPTQVPTADQIVAMNTVQRNYLLDAAGRAIAPLQDAVDLGVATAAEATLLTQWKQFRVAVNRVDLTRLSPTWPSSPEPLSYLSTGAVTDDA